jgi:two-component system, NtrC family, response regulator AtoC
MGETRMSTFRLPPRGDVVVGRDAGCDVVVEDSSVAPRHAVLHVGERLTLHALDAAAVTAVGSTRLEAGSEAGIAPGMILTFGKVSVVVQSSGASSRLRHVRTHGYFEGRVEDECARVDQSGGGFVVARFVLKAGGARVVEEALADCLRSMDILAMYTPDEYEALLVDCGRTKAREIIEDVEARVREGGAEVAIGWAHYPRDARTPEALFDAAGVGLRGPPTPPSEIALRATATTTPSSPECESAMARLHTLVERVAQAQIPVLVLGETGVGKEVMANAIHARSTRARRPLLCINCAAISETLLESELFGYERGAFTGAVTAKAGLLETADGGTVFLDEIGEMPLTVQAKLLRVIEQKQVTRLGALVARPIDVRFMAATNRDLEDEVASGRFRRDLFFRLNGFTLVIPPLRERQDEIDALAATFIEHARAESQRRDAPKVSAAARAALHAYGWPGNVRELRNVIERAVLLCTGDVIEPEHLPLDRMGRTIAPTASITTGARDSVAAPASSQRPTSNGAIAERERIVHALKVCAGNQTKAAEILGISRRALVYRIEQLGLPRPKKRV